MSSGAAYGREPILRSSGPWPDPSETVLVWPTGGPPSASPKSAILQLPAPPPSRSQRMFSSLMSPCVTPSVCRWCSPATIWAKMGRAWESGSPAITGEGEVTGEELDVRVSSLVGVRNDSR